MFGPTCTSSRIAIARVVLGAIAAMTAAMSAFAGAWPSDPVLNVPACIAPNGQRSVVAASDGAGGIILAWEDDRLYPPGNQHDIFAHRHTNTGGIAPGWPVGGAPVCTVWTNSYFPAIVADGAGGALIAHTGGTIGIGGGVFVQRLDTAGQPLWPVSGILASGPTAAVTGSFPAGLAADGAGGAYVSWVDGRFNFGTDSNPFVQHLASDGAPLWPDTGVAMARVPGVVSRTVVTPDGSGGAFVFWDDNRSAPAQRRVYAQRVSTAGVPLWAANGVQPTTSTQPQFMGGPITGDGAGGVYLGWSEDQPNGASDAYLQRLTSTGAVSPGWPASAVPLSDDPSPTGFQGSPILTADGAGGVVATWRDSRNLGIRIQRVDAAGNRLWGPSGVSVFGPNGGIYHATVSDSAGGFIVGTVYDTLVFAQRLNGLGEPQWGPTGVLIGGRRSFKKDLAGVPDGAHGAIFAWSDDRNEPGASWNGGDVYAQNVNADGTLGGTIVATALALVSAEAGPDRATLRWFSATERVAATLYRSRDGTSWTRSASLTSDGSGYVVYEDRDVVAGERYAYRLGVFEGGNESFTATTWVEIPAELSFALDGPWPQPAGEDLVLRITTRTAGRVRLRLHDLQGRTIATLIDGALDAGQHTRCWRLRDVAGSELAGGVYFARLETSGRVLSRRIVVSR